MRDNNLKLNLQYFAEGAEGEGGAASSGETAVAAGQHAGVNGAVAAGQQTQARSLEDLGVPKALAERHRARKGRAAAQSAETVAEVEEPAANTQAATQQAAAAQEEQPKEQPTQQSWEELMKNPEYNQKMRDTVKEAVDSRVKSRQTIIDGVTPVLELLGEKYGLDASDVSKMDMAALLSAMKGDDYLYEDIAEKMGTDVNTARNNMQQKSSQNARERELVAREAQLNESVQQTALRQHLEKMQADAAELKKLYPNFDLDEELKNEAFFRMTRPGGGLSVTQAYHAIHYREITEARDAQIAQEVARKLSNATQSGRNIPAENGSRGRGSAAVGQTDYRKMTKAEREAYRAQLMRDPRANL